MTRGECKSCDRKKCPYYHLTVCPHRKECEHSKDSVWSEVKKYDR